MRSTSASLEIGSERFSNGLEITASHVRLRNQTWAVGQIKKIGISPVASGIGIIICGVLSVFFASTFFSALGGGKNGVAVVLLLLASWCGYGVYSSWVGFNSTQVWLITGTLPTFIFKSRDKAEVQRVKEALERAIAHHTPTP